jgi:hypothetical protein
MCELNTLAACVEPTLSWLYALIFTSVESVDEEGKEGNDLAILL